MKTYVLSLGGSLIVPETIDVDFLKGFKSLIDKICTENRVIIVCGGGKTCRNYQNAADKVIEISDEEKDWIGIMASRLNAELVKSIFGKYAYEEVITDPTIKIDTDKKIIVGAGWKPGFSTDMDTVLLAKQFGAEEVLNISNADHVYDKDPNKFDDAKKFSEIAWEDYFKIIGTEWKPGMNAPFDPIASQEAQKSGIKVRILGKDIKNMEACLEGKEFEGTTLN